MRWFWRADPLTLVLDGLLEGSLVGVAYLALMTIPSSAPPPLPLFAFWLAAAAGLAAERLESQALRDWISVPALVPLAAVIGWLADPAVRAAIDATANPLDGISLHPAGWLLGLAVLRGAVHADKDRESDTCVDALTYSFPILGAALLLNLATRGSSIGPAFVGSMVCVVAGLLAVGHARLREFDSNGFVTGDPRVGPSIYVTLVVVAALAIPLAVLIGTVAQEPIMTAARLAEDAGLVVLGWIGEGLRWLLSLFPFTGSQGVPMPTPQPVTPPAGRTAPPAGHLPTLISALIRAGLVVVTLVVTALLVYWLLGRRRGRVAGEAPAAAVPEERHRDPLLARLHLRLALPSFHPRLPWSRRPTSAVEAYLALLDDLAGKEALARAPDETPRGHARRVADMGLEPVPLALLAADYQLAIYGRVDITGPETTRAIGRWQRLRNLARRAPQQ
jgi:hypothetical protein